MKQPSTEEQVDDIIERAKRCLQACEGLPDSALVPGSVANLVREARAVYDFASIVLRRDFALLGKALEPFKELV